MFNPYLCYIIGFAVSLLVYLLGWSEIYPPLSYSLLIFLIGTIVANGIAARIWATQNRMNNTVAAEPKISPWLVTVFLYMLWSLDFIYEGGIPLFKILLNIPFDYKKFGFPSLHVFTVTFSSFYSVYLFHLFLANKKRAILLLFIINMVAAILIYSRAMLFFNMASCVFLFLGRLEKIPVKKIALAIPVAVFLFYLFGVAGTMRVSFESRSEYNHKFFLESAGATSAFRNSFIPKEFYWSYFYISSPIANLQLNVTYNHPKSITTRRIFEYINNELLFESVSKRINKWFGIERTGEILIKEQFNVSTVYSRSYSYLGWSGMIIMASVILILPLVYWRLIAKSPYAPIGMAVLSTTFLFMSYDNTIRLMATGFQLVYPIVFPMIEQRLTFLKQPK